MEQNAAIEVYDPKVKDEILSPTVKVLDESKISEEKYQRACEARDEFKFRYLHFKQRYEKELTEKESLVKELANRCIPQTEVRALKAQVESLQDELEGYKSKVDEYKKQYENSCLEKDEIIRKSLEKVEQRALEAQVASLQDELQAHAECKAKMLQQEDLYKKALYENKILKSNANEFRALELQVASLEDELIRSNNQYAELSRRYAEKEKQLSDLEVKKCPACRASCSTSEHQSVKNEETEGLIQERNILEKKLNELVVQLENRTKDLAASEERRLRLEAIVEENRTVFDHLREEVDNLMKENSSLKPAQTDMLNGDISNRKPVVHKIAPEEEEGEVEEDQVEFNKLREEVDNLTEENSSLKPAQTDVLKGDTSSRKPVVHKIVSKKEEGKVKITRRRKTTDEGVTTQDMKTSGQHAPPSPLCEAGSKGRNLRKRTRNQPDKVAELAEDMETLNLKTEKKEKARTKRAPRPRKKKVQDENDPTQNNQSKYS
ncbi:myosin heavy chain, embryonic smooth muscle isoform isoform X2 [Anabrus simplex]|uniref:myosin heavy chain, embryonic smooth muscle isoform isoform X2 n=1 Tax=Anabrus simplex TaxID=316456 RepID=UPI0035A3334E